VVPVQPDATGAPSRIVDLDELERAVDDDRQARDVGFVEDRARDAVTDLDVEQHSFGAPDGQLEVAQPHD
jgi:hypothetical protein